MASPLPALPEPDLLERLVTLVDAAVAERGWFGAHVLIKVEDSGDPESFDLGFKDLPEGSHPATELWGFRAPPSWLAMGVVTLGWLGPMGEGRPSMHPERKRVRLTLLVDRAGRDASTAAVEDGTHIDEGGEGLVPDVLRLCMGAPTAPPPPIEVLADRMWLLAIAEACEHRPISWASAAALRQEVPSWRRARELAASSGAWPLAKRWMDDGFFARELLARLPSIDELIDRLENHLSRTTLRKLRAAVDGGC